MTSQQQQQGQLQSQEVSASSNKKNNHIPQMYLSIEDWSPRFQSTFFTIKMDTFQLMTTENPTTSSTSTNGVVIGGNTHLPAYYYKIEVKCGHRSHTVWRRYSQFRWLYYQQQQLQRNQHNDDDQEVLSFPPPTWWCQPQTIDFVQNRMEQLRDFLHDTLVRRGGENHNRGNHRDNNNNNDPIVTFLELDQLEL